MVHDLGDFFALLFVTVGYARSLDQLPQPRGSKVLVLGKQISTCKAMISFYCN